MRTVTASEVRKGMRVRVEHERGGATQTLEGVVEESRRSGFGDGWYIRVGNLLHANVSPDHPVTVLADPEPEWVEGAWYRVALPSGIEGPMRGVPGGWSPIFGDSDVPSWTDAHVTVLGRVLIVDWPGDDVALSIAESRVSSPYHHVQALINQARDAIRTQGGVR